MRRFVAIALLAFAPLAQAFDGAWTQKAVVTLDATYIDEAPVVVPIYLSGFDSTWWSAVQADGDDIRVTEDDETTERDYVLWKIDTGTSTGVIVVNVDGYASASVDVDLVVFAGNAGASAGSTTDTFVGTGYVGVYAPGVSTTDYSGNGRTLTAVNSPGTAAAATYEMDAATYSSSSSTRHVYEGAASVSDWPISIESILLPSVVTGTEMPCSIGSSANSSVISWYRDSSNFFAAIQGNGGYIASPSTGTMSASTYYYVAATRNATTGTSYGYNAGAQYSNATTINSASSLDRTTIGAYGYSTYNYHWTGNVAYFAISSEVRSADYIATMQDAWHTSAFRTYGATESNAGGATGHPWYFWRYRA